MSGDVMTEADWRRYERWSARRAKVLRGYRRRDALSAARSVAWIWLLIFSPLVVFLISMHTGLVKAIT